MSNDTVFNDIFPERFCQHCKEYVIPEPTGQTHPDHGYYLYCPTCGRWVAWGGKKAVIKDIDGKRKKSSRWNAKRLNVSKCQICGREKWQLHDIESLEIHHIEPIAENGPDTPENIIVACTACHKMIHYLKTYLNDHNRVFAETHSANNPAA